MSALPVESVTRTTRLHRALTLMPSVASVAALALAGCGSSSGGGDHSGHGGSTPAASSAPATASAAPTGRAGDIAFAQMMIPHHAQALEMSRTALDPARRASAPVQALAREIAAAQGPEITTMRGWLNSWGAPTAAPSASSGHAHGGTDTGTDTATETNGETMGMMSAQDMAALGQATGPAFDEAWLSMMIEHHDGAVEMAEQVRSTTQDAAVRAFAERVVTTQRAEIDRMNTLLG
ncbi:DUF305 domain-containing protein [Agilicoccus flavus]|uniref:DUF305 domain-containing protein n=1 Tax=Agilicoccus flavus TaxID=2775968 RepID=UPI001CF6FCAD|nr:DUF305 domain-containing protein [Agilicoccus flavus]